MEEALKERKFTEVEKQLLKSLEQDSSNIDILFKLAMVRLQFPFEDEETAIIYLDRILKIEPYNFKALCIKMYLQNYYYGEMDSDYEKIEKYHWKSTCEKAIAYYIMSWKYDQKAEQYLKESIEVYSGYVNPYVKLGRIYEERGKYNEAGAYYRTAMQNVRTTEFSYMDSIAPQAFIDEYITGVAKSTVNFDNLKNKVDGFKNV